MAVSFGSTAAAGSINTGTSITVSLATVSGDTRLVVLVGKAVGGSAPTGVTYNGVSLTADGNAAQGFNLSVWHIDNFTPGTFNVVATWAANAGGALIAIPLRGANLALAPSLGTATTGSSTTASCTAPAATSVDLQLAQAMVVSTTITSAGAPQSVVPSSPTMPITNIVSAYSFSADYLAAGSAGNFSWTLTSGTWNAWGVTVFASLPPLQPFTSTQFFVTDTIIQQ